MGQLTGSLAQDHVTQVERKRAGEYRARPQTTRNARICASIPQIRARFGASNPRVRRLAVLCRRAGY